MTKEGLEALRRVRIQAMTVRRLEELTGSDACDMTYFKDLIRKQREELKTRKENAKAYLQDLTSIEHSFVVAYFFAGLKLKEVSKVIGRSCRTCERLRSKFCHHVGEDDRQEEP